MDYPIIDSTSWRLWATPRIARRAAIHRWYLFPHSFTGQLVQALLKEWKIDRQQKILDPFVGAGTTLVAAQQCGVLATGYDLSPLAVLASNTKVASYSRAKLESIWRKLEHKLQHDCHSRSLREYPELVRRALPEGRLEALSAIWETIEEVCGLSIEGDFFRLALLSVIPRLSHAVADGGWLRWSYQGCASDMVREHMRTQVKMMLSDISDEQFNTQNRWSAHLGDARNLLDSDSKYSGVITSPPYPNRHDYTRVFGVELMFGFLNWQETRTLRYQSFHSHPESRPNRPNSAGYKPPLALERRIQSIDSPRIRHMLNGYFLDMHLCLSEVSRVCQGGAKIAFILGNAQYEGKTILVDEVTAELGGRVGLTCREIRAVRWRGNSAQQMGRFGRNASRESVVLFDRLSK